MKTSARFLKQFIYLRLHILALTLILNHAAQTYFGKLLWDWIMLSAGWVWLLYLLDAYFAPAEDAFNKPNRLKWFRQNQKALQILLLLLGLCLGVGTLYWLSVQPLHPLWVKICVLSTIGGIAYLFPQFQRTLKRHPFAKITYIAFHWTVGSLVLSILFFEQNLQILFFIGILRFLVFLPNLCWELAFDALGDQQKYQTRFVKRTDALNYSRYLTIFSFSIGLVGCYLFPQILGWILAEMFTALGFWGYVEYVQAPKMWILDILLGVGSVMILGIEYAIPS